MPARAVRLWPIEFEPGVPIGDWGPLAYGGGAGSEAPWRYEPSYWDAFELTEGHEGVESNGYLDWAFEFSRDEMRAWDSRFRPKAHEWQVEEEFPEMDRALADDSPFVRFKVVVYEWESGLS